MGDITFTDIKIEKASAPEQPAIFEKVDVVVEEPEFTEEQIEEMRMSIIEDEEIIEESRRQSMVPVVEEQEKEVRKEEDEEMDESVSVIEEEVAQVTGPTIQMCFEEPVIEPVQEVLECEAVCFDEQNTVIIEEPFAEVNELADQLADEVEKLSPSAQRIFESEQSV